MRDRNIETTSVDMRIKDTLDPYHCKHVQHKMI